MAGFLSENGKSPRSPGLFPWYLLNYSELGRGDTPTRSVITYLTELEEEMDTKGTVTGQQLSFGKIGKKSKVMVPIRLSIPPLEEKDTVVPETPKPHTDVSDGN